MTILEQIRPSDCHRSKSRAHYIPQLSQFGSEGLHKNFSAHSHMLHSISSLVECTILYKRPDGQECVNSSSKGTAANAISDTCKGSELDPPSCANLRIVE